MNPVTVESVVRWGKWPVAILIGLWQGLPALTQLLVMMMAVDIFLGLLVAIQRQKLSATVAWAGVSKKLVSLMMVGVSAMLNPHIQPLIQVNLVQAASAFYLVPELTSITKNAALMGVPVFGQLATVLGYFETISKQGSEDAKADTPNAE